MRKVPRLPTSHLPDYLKLDLSVGLREKHPLAAAIDDTAMALSDLAFAASWRLRPAVLPPPALRAHLEGLGFVTKALRDDETYALFDLHAEVLDDSGSLDTLRALAGLYLGECEVRRGRPMAATPLAGGGVTRLVLQDSAAGGEVLFVRTAVLVEEARREAFRATCRRFLPDGVTVDIVAPRRPRVVVPGGFNLSEPSRLAGRRL